MIKHFVSVDPERTAPARGVQRPQVADRSAGPVGFAGDWLAIGFAVFSAIKVSTQAVIYDIANDYLRRIVTALLLARFQVIGSRDRSIAADEGFAQILLISVAHNIGGHRAVTRLLQLPHQNK